MQDGEPPPLQDGELPPMQEGDTPLIDYVRNGCAQEVAWLLNVGGAVVDQPKHNGATALHIACGKGHIEIVLTLLAAGATVNQARRDGTTPLYVASRHGLTEIAAALLAAGAAVNQASNTGLTPLATACRHGHLSTVQLLSSHGAGRTFVVTGTAENVAAHYGHGELRAWLMRSRLWFTPLHHLEIIDAERARALLRDGADLRAALPAADAPTPLSLAGRLRAEGAAPPGSAAELVLRAAESWSPQTHNLFPSGARAQAVELALLGEQLSRSARFDDEPCSAIGLRDVWMAFVLPHAVTRPRPEEGTFRRRRLSAVKAWTTVTEMLAAVGLAQYAAAFEEEGYDDLTYILLALDGEEQVDRLGMDVGMEPGHLAALKAHLGV